MGKQVLDFSSYQGSYSLSEHGAQREDNNKIDSLSDTLINKELTPCPDYENKVHNPACMTEKTRPLSLKLNIVYSSAHMPWEQSMYLIMTILP